MQALEKCYLSVTHIQETVHLLYLYFHNKTKGTYKMKKALIVILTISFATTVFASSGRTDSAGCHTSKTEGYHCH